MSDGAGKAGRTELVLKKSGALARKTIGSEKLDVQILWFALARRPWRSLVVVPADESSSAAAVATALADVGRRFRSEPVTFLVMAGPMDYASAGKLVAGMTGPGHEASAKDGRHGRVIVAIPPVVSEPLGIAVTDAADAVVLCISRGRTRVPSVAKTIEMVGRDRIVGCVMT